MMPRRQHTGLHKGARAEAPRSSSRTANRRGATLCDVTLNDFANCEAKMGVSARSVRMKKGNLMTAMKNLTVVNDNDERPWDERDDDEHENGLAACNGVGGDGEEALQTTRDHKRRRRRVIGKTGGREEEDWGAVYPLDLWFLISKYIRPEDVGKFAVLCHATYYITTTTQFWLSVFKRHYQWSSELPGSLTYWNMDHRKKNIRVSVIRALFFVYAPFSARLSAEKPLSADPTQLLHSQCILQWHKKDGSQHKYYFKFAHPEHSCWRSGGLVKSVGSASAYSNPHSGCWLLEATSVGVCAVPMVMGDYLYHAGLGVSANLCSHCLHLALVPGPHLLPHSPNVPTRRHQVPATEITLDPVSNVRLYPWWHPQYWHVLETEATDTDRCDWPTVG